jgi:sugar lactone lactonase YvrE
MGPSFTKATNMRVFTDMMLDGIKCGPDGMRADVFGNLWISSNAPLGYAGVLCFTKEGKLIGRIRLPEVCANLAFGGPKRDRLFMAASNALSIAKEQEAKLWELRVPPASPGCAATRTAATRPTTSSHRYTAGSPKASTPPI